MHRLQLEGSLDSYVLRSSPDLRCCGRLCRHSVDHRSSHRRP